MHAAMDFPRACMHAMQAEASVGEADEPLAAAMHGMACMAAALIQFRLPFGGWRLRYPPGARTCRS